MSTNPTESAFDALRRLGSKAASAPRAEENPAPCLVPERDSTAAGEGNVGARRGPAAAGDVRTTLGPVEARATSEDCETSEVRSAERGRPEATPEREGDVDRVAVLQRQIEIQRKLIHLAKNNGIAFYRPHWYQHLFHSANKKRRGAFTGNRFGKSKMDGAETVAWARGERTWYKAAFDIFGVERDASGVRHKVFRARHEGGENHPLVTQGIPPYPTKQLVVCANWDKVDEIWTSQSADRPGYIWQFVPAGEAKGYTNHAGTIDHIVFKRGSVIDFMSVDAFKKNKMVAESSDYDRVVFDEPAPRQLWKGIARGLVDRGGQADFALTALEEAWIPEKFDGDPNIKSPGNEDDKPFREDMRFSFRASMYDNPHLSDQAIADYEAELTEDEKQCRISGIPLEYSGLVYKEFKKDIHVIKGTPEGWKDAATPPKTCVLHIRIDTHPVKPHAVLFSAVGPSEIPICYKEIYESLDADTLFKRIADEVKRTGCYLASLKMEPAAWINDPATKRASIASYANAHDLHPTKATKDLITGIIVTRAALSKRLVAFTENCRRTFWEFTRYRYDAETGKPVDEDDHMMENLYRLLISPTRWFDPDKAEGEPITDEEFTHGNTSTRDLEPSNS